MIVWSDDPRVYTMKSCPRCDGRGHFRFDDWRTIHIFGDTEYKGPINFGCISLCSHCRGSGEVVHCYSTRGVSIVPLIPARR